MHSVVLLSLALAAGQGADSRLPQEEAARYAEACVGQAGNPYAGQITVDADPAKACAVRGEGGGAMVVPDKQLNPDALAKLGAGVVPAGQLWLRKWTVAAKGRAVPADRLRMVTVNVDDKARPMPLLLLGVRQAKSGKAELLVYATASEPLLRLPLEKAEFLQPLPLEIEWARGEGMIDRLSVNVLGRYAAVIPVTRQAQ